MKDIFIKLLSGFSLLLILSCNHIQTPSQANGNNNSQGVPILDQPQKPSVKDSGIFYTWNVTGCASKAAGSNTKSAEQIGNDPDLSTLGENGITAEGDSIIYSRFVRHGCCRKAEVSTQRLGKTIIVTEYWEGKICKCMCSSIIRTVVQKLSKGEYLVYGLETGTDPITNKPSKGIDTVMSQKVYIK